MVKPAQISIAEASAVGELEYSRLLEPQKLKKQKV